MVGDGSTDLMRTCASEGEHLQTFWDDYDRLNTPSEDERAQKYWDDVDRELLGPDYKRILEVQYSR